MKIAVLGSQGQLGRDLCSRLRGDIIPLTRSDIDLANPPTIAPGVQKFKPDVLINCAAYNFVDRAEQEPDAAIAVNAIGPRLLAQACLAANVKLVHFSTDYVFGRDASRKEAYIETDFPGPVSTYGDSKLQGEEFVRTTMPGALVIRTCGLYGRWGTGGKGGNFVETMLRLASEKKPLRVVADQFCTPSYTVDVAEATASLLAKDAAGLFHVVNSGSCSWHEFAAEIFRQSGIAANLTAIPTSEYPTPAKRPGYSVLSIEKLTSLGITPRPWREALAAYLKERISVGPVSNRP